MPLTEWLAGRLAGRARRAPGRGRACAPRPLPRRRARAPAGRASARPAQSRRAAVGAADPRALVPPLRAVVVVRVKPLSILHTESSIGWGGQELRILTEMEGMARRGHRVHLVDGGIRRDPARGARARALRRRPADRGEEVARACARCARWLAQRGAAFDVINTHSSTDAWLVALARATLPRHAAGRAHAPCVDAGQQLADDALALPARDRGARRDRRSAQGAARARQRLRPRRASRRCAPASTLRASARSIATARARALRRRRAAGGRDRRDVARLEGPRRSARRVGDAARARAGLAAAHHRRRPAPRASRRAASPRWASSTRCASPATRTTCPRGSRAPTSPTLPSFGDEGVPQSLMQAAACGLPAVATPIGAIREAVRRWRRPDLLVPPRDRAGARRGAANA